LLERLEIPLRASERTESDPLVFGGGPVLTANPEPFAEFFDLVLLGDGELLLDAFIDAYQQVRGARRAVVLQHLAQVPGVYVPSLYQVSYTAVDGPIAAIQPLGDAPAQVQKQTYRGNRLSASTVVTAKAAWESIYMVEVVRSCPEMCRFACPTAVVSANDAVTPCNKMSLLHKEKRWPGRAGGGGPLWALYDCTGCGRCSTHCVYDMPVADQLFAARVNIKIFILLIKT
jgi:hypothetical protein